METSNKSKKISELQTLQTLASISKNKANTWFPAALYNSYNNSYTNIAVNIDAITNYCNSYSSYMLSYTLDKHGFGNNVTYVTYEGNQNNNDEIISYCKDYTYTIIHNEVEKVSKNMVDLINKIKNPNPNHSYIRNNSKKISELRGREDITMHQDHSWLAVAQYDSRVNSYHNIAMNIGVITGYCNSYSSYLNSYNSYVLDNKISYLQHHVEGAVAYSIIGYSFSYNLDYFEWQFL